MKKIALVVNLKKPLALDEVKRVTSLMAGMGFEVFSSAEVAQLSPTLHVCDPHCFSRVGVEGVVVLGGDGTMLEASHRLTGQNLPMMGLNMGSLGYLTSVERSQFAEALKHLRDDQLIISPRTTLSVRILRADGTESQLPDALNDIVVNRGASGHAVDLELCLNSQRIADFLCDGIIVATPTGSTAYSVSAGGPILLPDMPAFVVNAICPHTLTFRPLVVHDTTRISIRVVSCSASMVVCSDGRDENILGIDDRVEIRRSEHATPVIELQGYNPCDVLCRKLHWGSTPRRT